jgi:hypothetical protein
MIVVESKFHPYVLMSFHGERHTEAEYRGMFDALTDIRQRELRDPMGHVVISVASGYIGAGERQLLAKMIGALPEEYARGALQTFVISRGVSFRGILTALRWFAPGRVPLKAVDSVEAAMTGATRVLRANGITPGAAEESARRWLQAEVARQRIEAEHTS